MEYSKFLFVLLFSIKNSFDGLQKSFLQINYQDFRKYYLIINKYLIHWFYNFFVIHLTVTYDVPNDRYFNVENVGEKKIEKSLMVFGLWRFLEWKIWSIKRGVFNSLFCHISITDKNIPNFFSDYYSASKTLSMGYENLLCKLIIKISENIIY